MFDKKGTGFIEPAAVGDLLRALGKNPTQALLNELSSKLPGSISFDYFVEKLYSVPMPPPGSIEEFIQGFQVFDKDGNGFISSGELRYGMYMHK